MSKKDPRDIPLMKTTMEQMAQSSFPETGKLNFFMGAKNRSQAEKDSSVDVKAAEQGYYSSNDNNIESYNKNIAKLDRDYASFKPSDKVIVRCFHAVATMKGSIYLPPWIPMKEITQNGIGIRETTNSPWRYQRKAIVVAVPDHVNTLKPGDIVQLTRFAILPEKPSVDHPPHLPKAFVLSDWYDFEPPTSPTPDAIKHFGYLQVDPYKDVEGILNQKTKK